MVTDQQLGVQGSLIQVVLALVVTELFLLGFIRTMPYNDIRTNVLAILSQSIMVISYFSTIMLKLDEETRGTWLTEAGISYIMIAVNVTAPIVLALGTMRWNSRIGEGEWGVGGIGSGEWGV